MQALTLPRRDSAPTIKPQQQRFSFGGSRQQVPGPKRYRAAWISDAHLGTRGCNTTALLDFLRETDFDTLDCIAVGADASLLLEIRAFGQRAGITIIS